MTENKLKEIALNLRTSLCFGSDLPENDCVFDEIYEAIKEAYNLSKDKLDILEKENEGLKAQVKTLKGKVCSLSIKNTSLECKVASMKCCGNCKFEEFQDSDYEDVDENPCTDCFKYDNWRWVE